MLISDLYTCRVTGHKDHVIEAGIQVNGDSTVYMGHFPNFAVTPGVCQVLMIKEILQGEMDTPLRLSEAKYIKFTAVHEPGKARQINARISYTVKGSAFAVEAELFRGETRYLKIKGEFRSDEG